MPTTGVGERRREEGGEDDLIQFVFGSVSLMIVIRRWMLEGVDDWFHDPDTAMGLDTNGLFISFVSIIRLYDYVSSHFCSILYIAMN